MVGVDARQQRHVHSVVMMTSQLSFSVGDLVSVTSPSTGRTDVGPYKVEAVSTSSNRFRCRRVRDGKLTKKLPAECLSVYAPPSLLVSNSGSENDTNATDVAMAASTPAPRAASCVVSAVAAAADSGSSLTRLSLAQLSSSSHHARTLVMDALQRDSLFVLTDLGKRFERLYAAYLASAKSFFLASPPEEKKRCVSRRIYCNERGTPMWYCGYESTDIRECFRVPGGAITGGSEYIERWPAPAPTSFGGGGAHVGRVRSGSGGDGDDGAHSGGGGDGGDGADGGSPSGNNAAAAAAKRDVVAVAAARAEFEKQWYKVAQMLQRICDRCLALVLGAHAESMSTTVEDKSVSYTFHYHNGERIRQPCSSSNSSL